MPEGHLVNKDTTVIGADTDVSGVGRISFQTRQLERMSIENDGTVLVDGQPIAPDKFVRVSNYVSLAALLTAIGSNPTLILIDSALTVTANTTIPATARLWGIEPGSLTVNSGVTLTINSPIHDLSRGFFLGPGSVVIADRRVKAAWFVGGSDLGAQITAADTAVNGHPAEIIVDEAAATNIATQATVTSFHILRIGRITITSTIPELISSVAVYPILVHSNTAVIGDGFTSTVIKESTSTSGLQMTIIKASGAVSGGLGANENILVEGIQFQGANPNFDSARQTVSVGNVTNCFITDCFFNATRTIGIGIGGSSLSGNHAAQVTVKNCIFKNVASQNVGMVNGKNILIASNHFIDSGQLGGPGAVPVDIEPNAPDDWCENVIVTDNTFDSRNTPMAITHGNMIVIQNTTSGSRSGPVIVSNNTLIGGEIDGTPTNRSSVGIFVGGSMRDVEIFGNHIRRMGQNGIYAQGDRLHIHGNTLMLTGTGGGSIPAMQLNGVTNSRIHNNSLYSSTEVPGGGTGDDTIVEDDQVGTCNTSGTTVNHVSGDLFDPAHAAGKIITINGVDYTVAASPAPTYTTLTLTSSAGTQSGVNFRLKITFNNLFWNNVCSSITLIGVNSKQLSKVDQLKGLYLYPQKFAPPWLTPSVLNGNVTAYNPGVTNPAAQIRISADGDFGRTIQGMLAGEDGERRTFVNVGAHDIIIANEDSGASAANRILTGTNANVIFGADETLEFNYDPVTQRWRLR